MYFGEFRFNLSGATGSPKVTISLYSDNVGAVGTLIQSSTQSGVLSTGQNSISAGFSATAALVPGTQYWVVAACTSGTSCVISFCGGANYWSFPISGPSAGFEFGDGFATSSNNGTSWGSVNLICTGHRIGITNGTDWSYFGVPVASLGEASGATEILFKNGSTQQEFGTQFTSPSNLILNVSGIAMLVRKRSATGNLFFKLYTGAAPAGAQSTYSAPSANLYGSGGAYYVLSFLNGSQRINPGSIVTVTANNSAADDASHYITTYKYTYDTDANSAALFPFASMASCKMPGNTLVSSEIVPFWLMLDGNTPFIAPPYPPAYDVCAGVDPGDGTLGTLHASNIATAAAGGVNLSAPILAAGSTVDDVSGSLNPATIYVPIPVED